MEWSPALQSRFRLAPTDPAYCHINDMEFVVIILQLAGIMAWIQEQSFSGLAPTVLIYSDNTSSVAWAAAAHAKSPRVHGLIQLYADMLEQSGIKPRTEYITTEHNHQADFLSRLTIPTTSSPLSLHYQVSCQYSEMTSFRIYHPSSTLLSLIAARMSCDAPPVASARLEKWGQFAAAGSVSSSSCLG